MKKRAILLFIFILMLPLVHAGIEIEKSTVLDSVIPEINQPARFNIKITNNGDTDSFRIYSLVGIDLKPANHFKIEAGSALTIEVEAWPSQEILDTRKTFNFIYKIEGNETGIKEDIMTIKILDLDEVFDINSYNINLDSDRAVVFVKNRAGLKFPEVKARFKSDFFDFEEDFTIDKYEKKEFEVSLEKEKIKGLVAGNYVITTSLETKSANTTIRNSFKFTEKAEISTEEDRSGFIIHKTTVRKINQGNLPFVVQVKLEKNIISRLFTTFNIEPSSVKREGFRVTYSFQKEIQPAETLTVRASTNWLYPLILIIALIIIGYLVKSYTSTFLVLKKQTSFVRTKGGEFALKITLIAKARKFVERVKILDKVPSIVKVHKRFGLVEPDKIDEKNRRLEWNIDNLQPGEERVFSYIIYSKVAPVGKFELPTATATYERDAKIHEASSNRTFFLTEPRRKPEE